MPKRDNGKIGAQIDLLFDRTDGVITICEMKFTKEPFVVSKSIYKQILEKAAIYKKATGTRKQVFLALVSAVGMAKGEYSGMFANLVVLEDLFN